MDYRKNSDVKYRQMFGYGKPLQSLMMAPSGQCKHLRRSIQSQPGAENAYHLVRQGEGFRKCQAVAEGRPGV